MRVIYAMLPLTSIANCLYLCTTKKNSAKTFELRESHMTKTYNHEDFNGHKKSYYYCYPLTRVYIVHTSCYCGM
jgi:hypothetical protein